MLTPETIQRHFDSKGIKYMQSPDGDRFALSWTLGRHRVRTEILLHDDGEFVVMRTVDLTCVPHGHPARASILDRFNELSFKYRVLKAMIDPDDGEVTVTHELWCDGGPVDEDSFGRRYHGFLRFTETALDALDECMRRADPLSNAC